MAEDGTAQAAGFVAQPSKQESWKECQQSDGAAAWQMGQGKACAGCDDG